MATADDVDRLERERRDADRRYNEALTAFDHAVTSAAGQTTLEREQFDRLATALIVFLQQITAFVETKDRELTARASSRLEQLERALEATAELRAHIGILQRAVQTLTRSQPPAATHHALAGAAHEPAVASRPPGVGGHHRTPGHPPSVAAHQSAAGPPPAITEHALAAAPAEHAYKYVAFEDQFRGSDVAIEARLRAYVPIFSTASDVLDLGCGRGEFLAALKAAGVSARGVDVNGDMVAIARERGLEALQDDALAHVQSLPDTSLGGAIATQVIEHLEPWYLIQLLDALSQKLRRGAPIVLETINPACWLAFFSSYIRDFTHVRPVHHETLQYLLRASGFERVEIRFSAPVPDQMKMRTIDLPAEVLAAADAVSSTLVAIAQTINANAVVLNNLMFTHLDYAAVGFRA